MNTVIYASADAGPRCHEPGERFFRNQSPFFVSSEIVHDLDELFPELYCAAEMAIRYFDEEGGSEPPLIAAALTTTRDRLYRILVGAGLLDTATILPSCPDSNG